MDTTWLQAQWSWLLEDPAGQRIGLGLALVVGILGCFLSHKAFKARKLSDKRFLVACQVPFDISDALLERADL